MRPRFLSIFLAAFVFSISPSIAAPSGAQGAGPKKPLIIVMGSSSAAGKNLYKLFDAQKSDEAIYAEKYNWVTLYRDRLEAEQKAATVLNFAAAGHSTTKALSKNKRSEFYRNSLDFVLKNHASADALILNFPAIRGEEGENVALVLENLKEIERRALAAGVGKVWVATSQPYANKAECFKSGADSCHATLTIYQSRIDLTEAVIAEFPNNHIDFYTPLSKGRSHRGVANPALLNMKDKLHPNLDGHAALADVMMRVGVYEAASAK